MKKKFLLLFCFISGFVFSQEYHFDYFIKKKNERLEKERGKWEFEELYNSKNGLKVFFKINNNKILAVLNDNNNSIRHIFRVSKKDEKYLFFYKHSNRLNTKDKERFKTLNKENIITAEKIDSLHYRIFVFNNSSLKQINTEALITLVKSDFDYLEINADYNRSEDMEHELKKKLPENSKFKISKIQYLNRKGKIYYETNYEDFLGIDMILNVPEKIIFKETDYWSDFEE